MQRPSTRYTTLIQHVERLRDVVSCDVQESANGEVTAVHVTARAGRPAKHIVRDVETIFAAEEGLEIDHRKISVAIYGDPSAPSAPGIDRMALRGVSLHHNPLGIEAEVSLGAADISATGRAAGSNTRFEVRRVVALATLDAIAKLVDGEPSLSLGELEEKELGDRQVILVCVNQAKGRSEQALIGTCEVGYDSTQAVIFAVLDAVNRIVGTLRPRQPVEFEIGPAQTD